MAKKLDYLEWDDEAGVPEVQDEIDARIGGKNECPSIEEPFDSEVRRRIGELIVQAVQDPRRDS